MKSLISVFVLSILFFFVACVDYNLLQDGQEVESESLFSPAVLTGNANVRTGPCTSFGIITTLSAGTQLAYIASSRSEGCGFSWFRVYFTLDNRLRTGFIASILLGTPNSQSSSCTTRQYPLFLQCDAAWGNDHLGSSSNICNVGCLITSVAMALNGLGRTINGAAVTPKNFNSYLMSNSGYSDNYFIWVKAQPLGLNYLGQSTDKNAIREHICANRVVILAVNNWSHWVLATGYNGDTFTVRDPAYTWRTTYSSNEVSGAGIYSV